MPTKRRFARQAELAGHGHGRGLGVAGEPRIPPSADFAPAHHELLLVAAQLRVSGGMPTATKFIPEHDDKVLRATATVSARSRRLPRRRALAAQ